MGDIFSSPSTDLFSFTFSGMPAREDFVWMISVPGSEDTTLELVKARYGFSVMFDFSRV